MFWPPLAAYQGCYSLQIYDLPTDITYGYTYDVLGNIATYTENSTTYNYSYAGGKLLRQTGGGNTLDFFYDAAGNPVKLSDFVGKPVVLNVWATWCGFCVQELPYFHDAYLEYGDQIEFLIVNLNESVETSEQFFGDNGYSFSVYVNSAQELESAFGISGIPVTLFIDSNGNILRHSEGMLHEEEFQYYFNWLRAEIDA